ncbi:hypothetical protein [Bernardetia sp.]|uniref:hypothetical protein n=1 Tax=Bernardetia sp. TaxID=1937974 RepID=UPI0025BF3921|nr:hypothetical protein [Bernardetia sp.]
MYTSSYKKGDVINYKLYLHNPAGKLLKTTNLKLEYQSVYQDNGNILTQDALYLTFYDMEGFVRIIKIDFEANIKINTRINLSEEEAKFYLDRVSYFPLSKALYVLLDNDEFYITNFYKINKLKYGIKSRKVSKAGKVVWVNTLAPEKGSYEIKKVAGSVATLFVISTQKADIKEGESNRAIFSIDKKNGKLKKQTSLIHNGGTLMPSNVQEAKDGVILSGLFFDVKDSKGIFVCKYDDNGEQSDIYTYDWKQMYELKMNDSNPFMNPNMRLNFVASYIKDDKLTLVAEEFSTGLNLFPDFSISNLSSFYISPNNRNQILGNIVTLTVDLSNGAIEKNSLNKISAEAEKFVLTGIMPKAEVKLIGLLDDFGYTRILQKEVYNEKIFLLLKRQKKTTLLTEITDTKIRDKKIDISSINPKYGLYMYISSGKIIYQAVEKKEYSIWQEGM